jgi:hypothetical protein
MDFQVVVSFRAFLWRNRQHRLESSTKVRLEHYIVTVRLLLCKDGNNAVKKRREEKRKGGGVGIEPTN